MDTALLQAFIAVADSGSFSVASADLHLTQPAVSKRIAQLEGQLELRLFDRIGRRVTLTEAGTTLLPRARRILQDIRDAERVLRDTGRAVAGELALATSHHIGLHRLPPVLRQYRRTYPEVRLDIAFMDSEEALEAVLQGHLELAVITLPPGGLKEPLAGECIWRDPLAVVVSDDHPLAGRQGVSLDELAARDAVLPAEGTYTGQILRQLFAQQGLELRLGMTTNYLETLRMLVSIGLGWSLLPETMLCPGLQRLALGDAALERRLGLIYHRQRWLSRAARAFIDTLPRAPHAGPAELV
jgi:DNA-binding transcriptional LysR family regulator